MTILQIARTYKGHFGMFGFVGKTIGGLQCNTRVGACGYHPHIPDNTKEWYGNFKLELKL